MELSVSSLSADAAQSIKLKSNHVAIFPISAASGVAVNQDGILRYSTNGFNFHKHRVLLTRLIQGNANQFPTASLTIEEQVRRGASVGKQ